MFCRFLSIALCLLICASVGPVEALAQQGGFFSDSLSDFHETECVRKGWKKLIVEVGSQQRKVLWKGPHGFWPHGAIVVLHGGGGSYSDYCSNIKLGRPMVEFAEAAVKQGFAVFSLNSLDNKFNGVNGKLCGKRFDGFGNHEATNLDLPFIETLLQRTIPRLRPTGSKRMLFLAGLSNGGFMTVLAAAYSADLISGFAVVSAGDPFGTQVDCSKGALRRRNVPGILLDNETGKPISEEGSCTSSAYRKEFRWPEPKLRYNPPFKLFYHEGDPVVNQSCKVKLHRILVSNGFEDSGSFILPLKGWNRMSNHFWLEDYSQPMIDFFIAQTRPATSRARDLIKHSK